MAITIQILLPQITQQLSPHSETASLDAQVLIAHFLEKSRSWVLAHPEFIVDDRQSGDIAQAVKRLQRGEPLPYVIAHWEFYGLDFHLSPDVLIPRPETELLVERALAWLQEHPGPKRVIDVGTGSGCIAVSLAVNHPDLHLLLTDISQTALAIARVNAEKYGLSDRCRFQQADLLEGVTGIFDLLCANLPYIPSDILVNLPVADREPLLALDGGSQGLDPITGLLNQARDLLEPGGIMLLEIESRQGNQVKHSAQDIYPASRVNVLKDLSGQDRCVEIMPSALIVHLCQGKEWLVAQDAGVFTDASLDQAGFIHCSRPDQLLQVANHYYRGVPDMKVLWIDPARVNSEI
ncbi:MAG TPA: peptide chain release factor N(5)-glutamine methyltransferase, partial [Anaerolineales bacterium]